VQVDRQARHAGHVRLLGQDHVIPVFLFGNAAMGDRAPLFAIDSKA
jgi:hypothetical protein